MRKNDDLISRQDAIDALKNRWKKTRNYEGIGDDIAEECELYLKQLPAAQPEIIRCRDCLMHGVCRFEKAFGFDGYCSQAERG